MPLEQAGESSVPRPRCRKLPRGVQIHYISAELAGCLHTAIGGVGIDIDHGRSAPTFPTMDRRQRTKRSPSLRPMITTPTVMAGLGWSEGALGSTVRMPMRLAKWGDTATEGRRAHYLAVFRLHERAHRSSPPRCVAPLPGVWIFSRTACALARRVRWSSSVALPRQPSAKAFPTKALTAAQ